MAIITHRDLSLKIDEFKFIFQKPKSIQQYLEVVFVFGSADTNPDNSIRSKFLEYIKDKETPFNFITIEALYNDLKDFSFNGNPVTARRTALVSLELQAIEQAYSLVIFPESIGSYAELGYFTAIEETQTKIYVANDYNFSSESSYLNHLIDVIHNNRELRPLLMDFQNGNAEQIYEKFNLLIRNLSDGYRAKQHTSHIKNNKLLSLAITYELIRFMPFLTFTQLRDTTKKLLKDFEFSFSGYENTFAVNISLLIVSGLIKRIKKEETIYFVPVNTDYRFINFSLTELEKAKEMDLYLDYQERYYSRIVE